MRSVTAKWSTEKRTPGPRGGGVASGFRAINPVTTMSKESQLSVVERDFILEALRENVRLDGRGVDQFRPLNISFGEEYGHVKLQLGKTKYVPGNYSSLYRMC